MLNHFSDSGPLFLSIECGVDIYRACILDERLGVIAVEQVDIDSELSEFGTRNGVHTLGDRVTAPSVMRIKALEVLLDKLSQRYPDLIRRIVAISGATQPGVLHFLSPQFSSLLSTLAQTSHLSLSDIFTPDTAFSIPDPPSVGDNSTVTQVRQFEQYFGTQLLSSPSVSSASSPLSRSSSSSSKGGGGQAMSSYEKSLRHFETLEKGRDYIVSKTGARITSQSSATRLLKLREKELYEIEMGERAAEEEGGGGGVFGGNGRILLESGLMASILLGRFAPVDVSDACSTGFFNPIKKDWEDELLEFVMGGEAGGGEKLRGLLGEVGGDNSKPLGTISEYFAKRYGLSPDTLIVSFTNTDAATFLSFPLTTSPHGQQRYVLVSLSSESDSLFLASSQFLPHPDRSFFLHPARNINGREEGGDSEFVAMIKSKDAGLARSLSKDLYANGSWDVFTKLVAIVPHGGTLGLDGKQFVYFFPHGQGSFVQGFVRFVDGVKVPEVPDRKSNPRLLVENQFMSLRLRLSRFYLDLNSNSTTTTKMLKEVGPFDLVRFPKFEKTLVPTRLVVTGEASTNPAIDSILSTVFSAPTYLLLASGEKRSRVEGEDLEEYVGTRREKRGFEEERLKTSAAALGAGYKAAWVWTMTRTKEAGGEGQGMEFGEFLREELEAQEKGRHLNEAQLVDHGGGGGVSFDQEEQYPISSVSTNQFPSSRDHRRSSSVFTLDSTFSGLAPHSRHGSIYSTTTSIFSTPPSVAESVEAKKQTYSEIARRGGGGGSQVRTKQKMYDPRDDEEGFEKEVLGEDPPGLDLVAAPDQHEFKYYSSMLPEYARLEKYALKGLL
ncbi:xylulokinase [Sporobolomyces salmoneus]|uniref:xylulokinase n=1 Tax=Sporobolomyces salmoneus TaxID=183962 RepID=UPI003181590D